MVLNNFFLKCLTVFSLHLIAIYTIFELKCYLNSHMVHLVTKLLNYTDLITLGLF